MAKSTTLLILWLAAASIPLIVDGISSECQLRLADVQVPGSQEMVYIVLSSGTNLPYDAGKYQMCLDTGTLRYFLVTMNASMSVNPKPHAVPLELGLCLPDACIDSDIPGIMESSVAKMMIPTLAMFNLTQIVATSPQLDVKLARTGTWFALAVVVFFALLVVGGSWNELRARFLIARSAALTRLSLHSRDNMAHLLETGDGPRPNYGISALGSVRGSKEPAREPSGTRGPVSQGTSSGATMSVQAVAATNERRASRHLARVLQTFSLFGESGTLSKVVECPPYKPTDSLNGLRVISMFWIVWGHTFMMPKGIAGYSNNQDIMNSPLQKNGVAENDVSFMVVLGAQISVDTFFFLSGFLLSLLTLRELRASRGKTNLTVAIVLRYIRLTPSLALAMLVYYQIFPYLGHGPFSPRYQESILGRCDGSWWSELTYSMNFAPFDSDKVCMGWTWYLGDDMIFFIMSIAILPLYSQAKWLGWLTVGVISCASFAVTIWLCLQFNLSPYVFDNHYTDYSYWAYSKPYSRVPAYFVGLVSAWVLDDLENIRGITRQNRIHTMRSRILATMAFLLCVAVLLFIVLIPATDFGLHKNDWDANPGLSAMYLTFSRPLWSFVWAVITILCYYDYLPLVNGFLAHSAWTPFARLTYGAYLCHPLVIKLSAGNATQYYNFSGMDLFYRWFGNTALAYGGALVLWCLVERPTMTVISMLMTTKKPSPRSTSQEKRAPTP